MSTLPKALRLADALEELDAQFSHTGLCGEAAAELRRLHEALETEQEPVAWLKTWSDGSVSVLKTKSHAFADHELEPLYTAPPKKQWVSLTDQEVWQAIDNVLEGGGWLDVARVLEQAFKEKNT